MGKVLFTSHTANFVKFNIPYMKWFKEQGWEVHYASMDEENIPNCDKHFKIHFNRSPFSLNNIVAYFELKRIIKHEKYDIIHCHTPMGGVVTRLAARNMRKQGVKILYTAHGFHFYKGAPLKNWLLYYPVEKILAKYTDCLIVLNSEDYILANKEFTSNQIELLNGVGVDLNHFNLAKNEEYIRLREQYGYKKDDFILIYVAEFIKRKNHKLIINILKKLKQKIPELKVLFIGRGELLNECQQLVQDNNVKDIVSFLGYRNDVNNLYKISNLLISSSIQEGLPVNIIEGMACGLPIICAKIRGQTDIIKQGRNGLLFSCNNKDELYNAILKIYNDVYLQNEISKNNRQDAQRYALGKSIDKMSEIYKRYM